MGDGVGILARRYKADGSDPLNDFIVNSSSTGNQIESDVAFDGAGNFIVTWANYSSPWENVSDGVYAKRYRVSESQSSKLEFLNPVASVTAGSPLSPVVQVAVEDDQGNVDY